MRVITVMSKNKLATYEFDEKYTPVQPPGDVPTYIKKLFNGKFDLGKEQVTVCKKS